jgi:ArsR family transcriptional regulator
MLTDQEILMYIQSMPVASRINTLHSDRAVTLFHALSDDTRLSIIGMLRSGERCVCELQDELDAEQSRLSFHLKVLRDAGLVSDRREGRWSYYSIVPERLAEVHDLVIAMLPKPASRQSSRASSCCA